MIAGILVNMAEHEAKFTFQYLDGRKFPSIQSKDAQELLLKWSMKDRLLAQTFSFDQHFQPYQKDDFVQAFFQDAQVLYNLQVVSDEGKVSSLGLKASSAKADVVSCTVLSMSFFDRLYDNNIVRESGKIMKCFDEYWEDFIISDELRKMLLMEDSDNYDLYSDTERDELLFRIFKHLCLGGAVCQYEDEIQPYLDMTKQLYKDLVTVQKDAKTSEIHITSTVLKVSASGDGGQFYPSGRDHVQDFSYMIIDPLKRHVTVLYHCYGACLFDSVP